MSELKRLTNITQRQIRTNGVQALADKPNLTAQYGVSGLSAEALKKHFDKLASLLADKVNAIHDTLAGEDATQYINSPILGNLLDFLTAFDTGEIADYINAMDGEEKKTLQTIINGIRDSFASVDTKADKGISDAAAADTKAQVAIDLVQQSSGIDTSKIVLKFTGEEPPTSETVGVPGNLYLCNGEYGETAYICLGADASGYVWRQIALFEKELVTEIITETKEWKKPDLLASDVTVRIFGGGGGGGSAVWAEPFVNFGGGGGGGHMAYDVIPKNEIPQTVAITIGAGGSGGEEGFANAQNGGITSFGNLLSASGGSASIGRGNGGSGGSGGGGSLSGGSNAYGGAGGTGGASGQNGIDCSALESPYGGHGYGGSTNGGGGGFGGNGGNGTANTGGGGGGFGTSGNGGNGTEGSHASDGGYAAGGGGAGFGQSGKGGNGGAGICILTYYVEKLTF